LLTIKIVNKNIWPLVEKWLASPLTTPIRFLSTPHCFFFFGTNRKKERNTNHTIKQPIIRVQTSRTVGEIFLWLSIERVGIEL